MTLKMNKSIAKRLLEFGSDMEYIASHLLVPASGIIYIGYDDNYLIAIDEKFDTKWEIELPDISNVSIERSNTDLGTGKIHCVHLDGSETVVNADGIIMYPCSDKIIDVKYSNIIAGDVAGYGYIKEASYPPVKTSKFLRKGTYEIKCDVEAKGEYKLFDVNSNLLYIGSESSISININSEVKQNIVLCSRDDIKVSIPKVEKIKRPPIVHFIGDSTLANYSTPPMYGWAQLFQAKTGIISNNQASCGRSTESFIFEGRFNHLLNVVRSGDIVVIGFGHNDEKENFFGTDHNQFEDNLIYMQKELRKKRVKVIFTTPIPRRDFEGEKLRDTHLGYDQVIRNLGDNVIDLTSIISKVVEQYGIEESKDMYTHIPRMEVIDNTHLSYFGANLICDKFIQEYYNVITK